MNLPSVLLLCVIFVLGKILVEGKMCPPLELGPNMATYVNVTSVNASSEPVSVICNSGFTLETGETIQYVQCEATGSETAQWNSSLAECSPVSCTTIPEVVNAHVIYSSTSYGSVMSVVCASGYLRSGSPNNISFVCDTAGQWQILNNNNSTTADCGFIIMGYGGCRQSPDDLTVAIPNVSGPGACITYCKSKEKTFSAVKGGNCYCETNLTTFGNSVDNLECNTICDFNQDTYCGGPDQRFSVYLVFDGCYSITDTSVFDTAIKIGGRLDTSCLEYCRGLDSLVALVTRTYKCLCVNVISNITAVALQMDMCTSSGSQLSELGLSYDWETTVLVWTLDPTLNPRTGDSCSDLYVKGVMKHGDYYTGDTTKERCQFMDGTVCEDNWVGYQGNCYRFSTNTKDYNGSHSFCLDKDAHMVSVSSEVEELFLEDAIKYFASYRSENNIWYLGLYDSQGSAAYQWSDGSILAYTKFKSTEPSRPFVARCAAMIGTNDVEWFDQTCVDKESYICKKQPDWYYGCIAVTTADLNVSLTHTEMSIGMCFQKCLSLNVTYSAVNDQQCYCFNTVPSHMTLSWSSCDIRCPGHLYQPCGGNNQDSAKTTIYVTGGSSPPALAESCDELEIQGLTEDTFLTTSGYIMCSAGNGVTCPFSWINVDGQCYKFMIGSSESPSTTCATHGAYLVSFTDEQELQKIRDVINSVSTLRNYNWWLTGLIDNNKNDVFRWSSGQSFNHSAFTLTQTVDKRCNAFYRDIADNEFVTTKCGTRPFICEKGSDYVGCFETPSHTAILSGYKDMTISVCVELCRGQGHSYGLVDITSCWCNDSVDMATSKLFSSCSHFCLSSTDQPCGGEGHVSAYHVASFPEIAQSCEDIFQQGILVPGMYRLAGEVKYCTLSDNTTCPTSRDGSWIGVGQNGYCLMFGFGTESDADAMNICRARGGVLASSRGTTEWDFLKQIIKYSLTLSDANGILLGARDEFHNGLYSWADGSIITFGFTDLVADLSTTSGVGGVATQPSTLTLQNKNTTDKLMFMCSVEKEYDGCYEYNNDLESVVSNYSSMTLTLCRQLCLGQNQKVALLHVSKCLCTTESMLSDLQYVDSDPDCEVSCQGHTGQNCATGTKLRAYKIENSGLPENCSDLYFSGVLHTGTYKLYDPNENTTRFQQCGFDINDFSCPPGWLAHNRTCLQVFPLPKSQKQASDFCFQKGGYLFTPKYPETFQYITNLITAVPQWGRYSKWRTGAREVMREGHVVLADGVYLVSETLKDDIFYDDVCIIGDITTQTLHRNTCDGESLPFICEMDKAMSGCNGTDSSPSYSLSSTNEMSVSQCMETCRGQTGNTYFALQNTVCYCYSAYNPVSAGVCTTACAAQPNQQCGGTTPTDLSVYHIAPYSDTILSSCTELYMYGVTLEGWYLIQHGSQTSSVQCFNYGNGYDKVLGASFGSVLVSSEAPGYPANSARLGSGELMPSSWKPENSDSSPYVELVLPDLYIIKAIFIQGGQSLTEQAWVMSFSIKYTINNGEWTSSPDTLTGNADRSSVKHQFLADPFLCDRVKVIPLEHNVAPAMRVELLGQLYAEFDHADRYVGCFVDVSPTEYISFGAVSTFTQCLTNCTAESLYPFMALVEDVEGTTHCKCGLTVGQYGQMSSEMCIQPCDFPDTMCGKEVDNVLAVYRTYEKQCPDRESPVNSTMTVTKVYNVTDVMTFQTQIDYTCSTGYEFPDHSPVVSVTCLQTNEWSGTVPNCQVKHCAAPADVQHSSRDSSDTTYSAIITYTCDPGHVTSTGGTTQTTVCEDSKTWSVNPEPCVPRTCVTPPSVNNSVILEDTSSLVYGNTLTYKCHASSMFSDNSTSKTTTCGTDGEWSNIPSHCQFYQCPIAPYVSRAVSEYHGDFLLRYTCETDYEFEDGSAAVNSTCGSDNIWSPVTKQCVFSASAKRRESQVCLRETGKRIVGSVEVTSARSSLSCGVLCLQNAACRYYNYNSATPSNGNNCQLFVDTTAHVNFVADSGWDSYILRDSC